MKFTLSILVLFIVSIAHAADLTVADSSQLNKAIKASQPGDTLTLKDGDWHDTEIKFFAEGVQDKPITLRAQTPGKVILSGQSRLNLFGHYLVVDGLLFTNGSPEGGCAIQFRSSSGGATHCRLTNCAIIDYNSKEKDNEEWVSLYGHDNRVDHCYFRGKTTGSPMLIVWVEGRRNEHHIDHNYFAGRPPLGRNGGETIRVGTSEVSMNVSKTLVEENLFEHCDGEAEVISNKSCENIYRFNTFVECKGDLCLRHGNRNTVESNWFFGHGVEGTGGIRLIGEDQKIFNNYLDGLGGSDFESAMPVVNGIPNSKANEYFRVKRATVCFNTLVNCKQNITFGIGVGKRNRAEPPMDCTYANNVIVSNSGPLVKFQDQPINTKWIGNFFFGADAGLTDPGVSTADPKLSRGADGIWRPSNDSPLIGAASGDFDFVTDDIEGRPRSGARDAGCFQHSGDATRHPISAKDVGPDWMREGK